MNAALADAGVKERIVNAGMAPGGGTSAAFGDAGCRHEEMGRHHQAAEYSA